MSNDFPDAVKKLFWEVDPSGVDVVKHRDYVLERVITRGGWNAMKWLRRVYNLETIGGFLLRKGSRLDPRDLAYWALITNTEVAVASGGRPPWAGP